jgi:hypothetical protein
MMTSRIGYIFRFALLAALCGFAGFNLLPFSATPFPLAAAQPSTAERLQELSTMIVKEIGTPTADEPSQCKLIAVGSKPCGGPAGYLVYSTTKSNEARLKQMVAEFNQLAQRFNQERKLMSDCMLVTEPKMEFADGLCRIKAH